MRPAVHGHHIRWRYVVGDHLSLGELLSMLLGQLSWWASQATGTSLHVHMLCWRLTGTHWLAGHPTGHVHVHGAQLAHRVGMEATHGYARLDVRLRGDATKLGCTGLDHVGRQTERVGMWTRGIWALRVHVLWIVALLEELLGVLLLLLLQSALLCDDEIVGSGAWHRAGTWV